MSRKISKMAIVASALVLLASTTAVAAQDLRSPDARPGTAQDLRSPDARTSAVQASQPATQDLRSPDARGSGRPISQPPSPAADPSGSFDWAYLAIGGLVMLLITGAVLLTHRRRRDAVAIGG